MTTDCTVYISSVANPRKHPRKISCLENFAQGVAATGDTVITEWDTQYRPSRLAVILGWATTNTGGPNITLRKQIIAEQQRRGFHTLCIDASCWKYLDNAGTYLRYSLNGPFYDRAEYANVNSTAHKWQEISAAVGVGMMPYNSAKNGHVLICMQRDGGFAMKSLQPMAWLAEKISQIRQVSNRTIYIRPHPGDYRAGDFDPFRRTKYFQKMNVHVLDCVNTSLLNNLAGAHSAVFFNSSASVAAVLQGIPVFVDDQSCVSWQVANHDVNDIENPKQFEREQWLYDLASAHWSDEDGRTGRIYQKFLPFIKK
jgi:hypothetical protein